MLDSGTVRSNVVFILDHSRNMQGNGKTDAARKELLRDLNAMTPEHKFNVLCVNPAGYERMPRGSVEAGSGSIRGLKDWLFLIDHRFGSNPAQAVERALGMVPAPGSLWLTNWLLSLGPNSGSNQAQAVKSALNMGPAPDTLWLLSDGEFSPQVIAPIRQANDTVHAHINTDAIFSRDGGSVLREISQENYGIYRFIPPPDNKNNSPPDGTSPPPVSSDAKPPSPP
jgi:hypothetical protein